MLVFIAPKQKTQQELGSTLAVAWSLSCHKVGWRPQEETSEECSNHVGVDVVVFREF